MADAINVQALKDQIDALKLDGEFSQADINYLINYLIAHGDMTGSPRDMIQIRRGNAANLPTLAQGELAFTLDTEELYIGGLTGNVGLGAFKNGMILVKNKGATFDATSEVQAILNAAGGKVVMFEANQTYKITSNLIMQDGTTIIGNNATLNFNLSGNVEGLVVGNRWSVSNLTINAIVVTPVSAGAGGQFQTAISIGNYGTGAGKRDIVLRNLTLSAQRTDGNIVNITGDSYNILVENIYLPDNNNVAGGIQSHWGGADNPSAGTTHPHNITIRNVRAGKFLRNSPDQSVVNFSGCYNVHVENVEAIEVQRQLIDVQVGDYGFYYAQPYVKDLVSRNIQVKNCVAMLSHKYGYNVSTKAPLAPGAPTYDSNITFEKCYSRGDGTATVGAGFQMNNCRGVIIVDCEVTYHAHGFSTGEDVRNVTNLRCKYHNNYYDGLSIANGSIPPQDIYIKECELYDNGFGGSGTSRSGVEIFNGKRIIVDSCKIGNQTAEVNQYYGIYLETVAVDARIMNNTVYNVKSGGTGYKMAQTSSVGVLKLFSNNVAESTVSTPYVGVTPQPTATNPS